MSEKVEYSEEELAEMTVKNNFLLQATIQVNSMMFGTIASMINPDSGKRIEKVYLDCIQKLHSEMLEADPKLQDAFLRQKLKDELGDLTFE